MVFKIMIIFIAYIILGILSGFLSGLLGLGGGIIIVPVLSFLFDHFHIVNHFQFMHLAIGTSLAISIVSLSAATKIHYQHQAIDWKIVWMIIPGIVAGSIFIGPRLLTYVDGSLLKMLFGFFCIFIAAQIFFTHYFSMRSAKVLSSFKATLFGVLTGVLSTLLGVSGGIVVGSVLNHYNLDVYKVIGTTSVICIVVAIASTCGLLMLNHDQPGLPAFATGYIYWPAFCMVAMPSLITAPLGSQLAHKLPVALLKKLFAILVLCTGLKMLF